MPTFSLKTTHTFTGAATTTAAASPLGTLLVEKNNLTNAKNFVLDGAGNAVELASHTDYPTYISSSVAGDLSTASEKYQLDVSPRLSTSAIRVFLGLHTTFVYGGNYSKGFLFAIGKSGGILYVSSTGGVSADQTVTFTRDIANNEEVTYEWSSDNKGDGTFDVTLKVFNTATPTNVIYNNTFVGLNAPAFNTNGIATFGTNDQGNAAGNFADIKFKEARQYEVSVDTAGPVIAGGSVSIGGKFIDVDFTEATPPVLPATGATGFTFEQSANGTTGWAAIATGTGTRIAGTKYQFAVTSYVEAGYSVRVRYTAAGGNVTDSQTPANAMVDNVNVALTNNSRMSPTANSFGKQCLSTRGFARTGVASAGAGKEVINEQRLELPFGARSGAWRFSYSGFTEGSSTSNILIRNASIRVVRYDVPTVSEFTRLTFAGVNDATIAPDAIAFCDNINVAIRPGDMVFVRTMYRCSDALANLPVQSFFDFRGGGTVATHYDAAEIGNAGAVLDKTMNLNGSLATDAAADEAAIITALTTTLYAGAGQIYRAWGPLLAEGRPHPNLSIAVKRIAPLFIGDSINVQTTDEGARSDGPAYDPYGGRGFNGRICRDAIPYCVYGAAGSSEGGFVTAATTPLGIYLMGAVGTGVGRLFTHVHDEYGINSLRTYTPVANAAETTYSLRQQGAGVASNRSHRYTAQTLLPVGSTADIITSGNIPGTQAERIDFNGLVITNKLTVGTTADGAFEAHLAVGTNTASAATLPDFLHPNALGMGLIADKGVTDIVPVWYTTANSVPDSTEDTTPPTITGASLGANGVTLTITTSETTTGSAGFTVTVGGVTRSHTPSRTNSNTVTLTLSSAAYAGQLVTLAYAQAAGDILDTATTPNEIAAITSQAVTNNSTQTAPVTGGGTGTITYLLRTGEGYPADTVYLTAGDTGPDLEYQVKDDAGNPVPLASDAVVNFILRKQGDPSAAVDAIGAVAYGAQGLVTFDWASATGGVVPAAGVYQAQWSVGGISYPLGKPLKVMIAASLD